MAAKKSKARAAAANAWESPYLHRVLEDAELRDSVRAAYESARKAYGRLTNGKPAGKALMEDKKLHKELRNAADSLRQAGDALRGKPQRRRGGTLGRLLIVALIGGLLAIALNEDLRNKVIDALFGAEEEFDYSGADAHANGDGSAAVADSSGVGA